MIEGLRLHNVKVTEFHSQLWYGIEDRINIASGGWLSLKFPLRIFSAYLELFSKTKGIKSQDTDAIIIGYPGLIDVFFGWILARMLKKPLIWDIFMSLYLISSERQIDKQGILGLISVKILRLLEFVALRLPNVLIIDTEEYADWFSKQYKISRDKFHCIPTGANDRIFFPRKVTNPEKDFTILYYGSFIPNHGVLTILHAAVLLREYHNLRFLLVGDGPQKKEAIEFSRLLELDNVIFLPWLEQTELINIIARSNICLGVFGNTPQSIMTIQNKIYECLAMAKPIITGRSKTIQKAFIDKKHLVLCNRLDPKSLADSILLLYCDHNLRKAISISGYNIFIENYSTKIIGEKFYRIIESCI